MVYEFYEGDSYYSFVAVEGVAASVTLFLPFRLD